MSPHTTPALLILLFLHFLGTCVADQRCYYPNSSEAADDFPCDPDAEDSVCCGGGQASVCLSNKLCQGGNGNIVRGSCTDDDWTSSQCPRYCMGAAAGGTDLISCAHVTELGTSYCCDHMKNCCDSGVGRFDIMPEKPEPWATFNVKLNRFVVVGTLFSEKTSTSSVPTTTPSTSKAADSTSTSSFVTAATSAPTSSTTSSLTSTSSSATTSSTSVSNNEGGQADSSVAPSTSGLSTAAIGGIAAAVGVSAVLLTAAAFLFWRSRKRNDKVVNMKLEQPLPSYYPSNYIPKDLQQYPQELHGHQRQPYDQRQELPAR